MFVAWRDLRFAKGRFALMGAVVILITVLVGLLSGLTAGLAKESTSAISGLSANRLVFSAPADGQQVSFADSRLGEQTWHRLAQEPGVHSADPLGITTTKAETGGRSASVSAFGVQPGSTLAPDADRIAHGQVVLSDGAADDLDAGTGDTVTIAGHKLHVAAVSGEASYSHTSVIWTSLGDWQQLGGGADHKQPTATVVALHTGSGADLSAADARLHTTTVDTPDALSAIGSFSAENGSLNLMRGFLFAISALVIGAFFTVWTIQRSGDIAVLKALGASTRYLLRDALGQAVALLVIGTGAGIGIAAGLGAAVGGTVPFVLDTGTVLLPAGVMIVLGALGAALSIRRITAVDPLTALGSAR